MTVVFVRVKGVVFLVRRDAREDAVADACLHGRPAHLHGVGASPVVILLPGARSVEQVVGELREAFAVTRQLRFVCPIWQWKYTNTVNILATILCEY